jgi:FdhD protein
VKSPPLLDSDQDGLRQVATARSHGGLRESQDDLVAREEPLEIRIGAISIAVVMRTPGHDEELTLGFLLGEGIIDRTNQVRSIRHCTTAPSPESDGNIINVRLDEDTEAAVDLESLRRNLFASSSCGICGKATIENAMRCSGKITDLTTFDEATVSQLPQRLREQQQWFESSGGLHGVGLFNSDGAMRVVREDVGRHNAVDKVIGFAAAAPFSLAGHGLFVSGRVSFEIVQKALAARIPLVAAVSAPTSLAVETAEAAGITLVAFVRDGSMKLYSHAHRITRDQLAARRI